jgi:hypothetical protein
VPAEEAGQVAGVVHDHVPRTIEETTAAVPAGIARSEGVGPIKSMLFSGRLHRGPAANVGNLVHHRGAPHQVLVGFAGGRALPGHALHATRGQRE